jgi:hypothetical protein
MGRKSRAKQQRREPDRSSSRLSEHQRKGRKLTPPLLALPGGVQLTDWPANQLPELLWVAAMQDAYAHPTEPAYAILDALDPFVEDGKVVDGRISTFASVADERRGDAVEAVMQAIRDGNAPELPDDLGHALALYPTCPALWLYGDQASKRYTDAQRGVSLLRRLLESNFSSRSESATHLRAVPLGRWAYHGKLHIIDAVLDRLLWPRYPGNLTDDERAAARAEMRATYGAIADLQRSADDTAAPSWPADFWRASYRVSPCELPEPQRATFRPDSAARVPSDDEAVPAADGITSARAAYLLGWEEVAAALRKEQTNLDLDLYAPTADEVRLGLASRQMRLLRLMFSDPHLWVSSAGPHMLRSMVDVLITTQWLLLMDDSDLYSRYRLFGLGHTKLYKQHLEDHADARGSSEETEELLRTLSDEIDIELGEEFVEIDLGGNFAGTTLRQMAEAVDDAARQRQDADVALKSLYTLAYAPFSAESHGEWNSLTRFDLRRCRNPMHRYHRVARFDVVMQSPRTATLDFALDLTIRAVCAVFQHYGVDGRPHFDALETLGRNPGSSRRLMPQPLCCARVHISRHIARSQR